MPIRVVLLSLLVAAAMVGTAVAQISPFGRSLGATYTDQDSEMLEAASQRLLADGVEIGAEEAWDNPASGNRGRIKLIDAPTIDGLPCRKLVHQVRLQGQADPVYLSVITCRTADGTWKNAY